MISKVNLVVLSLVIGIVPVAAQAKDCSQAKSMAELKACDPTQYESVMKIMNDANASLAASDKAMKDANTTMENHVNELKSINEDLKKINEQAHQWNQENK